MTRPQGVALLLLVTAIWGTTFVVIKGSLDSVPPSLFLALRFTAAALALLWVRPDRRTLKWAVLLGLASFVSYGSQTVGLVYTTASKAAFITGLSVVITPFLTGLVYRTWVPGRVWFTAMVALAGLALMTLTGEGGINVGDVIIVGTAFAYAAHLLLIAEAVKRHDPLKLAAMQFWPVLILSWIWAAPHVHLIRDLPASLWWSIAYLALIATALVAIVQNYAQRVVPAHVAALIFVLEPVVAAIFGWIFQGDRLGVAGWIGGGLVVAAMLISELAPPRGPVGKEP